MLQDLIPLVPLTLMFHFNCSRLFFLVKCIRISKSMKLLDTKAFMRSVKSYFNQILKKACEDPDIAEEINLDNNNIMSMLYIGNSFKVFKLVIVIFMVSYFIGIFFYIWCDLTDNHEDNGYGTGENFIETFKLYKHDAYSKTLIITYFAFTSLSTVGFGDFNPRSDYERVLIAMILMFGVAIFSYVMGNFLEILNKF